jgi:hypothetical protein
MGKALTHSVGVLATGTAVAGALLYGTHLLRTSDIEQLSSVVEYRSVVDRATEAEARERRMKQEGMASFSYQLALSRRQTLTARIEKTVAAAGVTLVGKDVTDAQVELRFTDSHLKALKLLAGLEAEFPELRPRAIVWAAQPDGQVNLTATYDVWPIPAPGGRRAS